MAKVVYQVGDGEGFSPGFQLVAGLVEVLWKAWLM